MRTEVRKYSTPFTSPDRVTVGVRATHTQLGTGGAVAGGNVERGDASTESRLHILYVAGSVTG